MARTTVARLGGFTFLFYISASIVGTNLFARITKGDGIAAKLANIAAHRPQMGLCFILTLLTIFAALILAVALYALTRDEDAGLALLALTCRVVEGVLNAVPATGYRDARTAVGRTAGFHRNWFGGGSLKRTR